MGICEGAFIPQCCCCCCDATDNREPDGGVGNVIGCRSTVAAVSAPALRRGVDGRTTSLCTDVALSEAVCCRSCWSANGGTWLKLKLEYSDDGCTVIFGAFNDMEVRKGSDSPSGGNLDGGRPLKSLGNLCIVRESSVVFECTGAGRNTFVVLDIALSVRASCGFVAEGIMQGPSGLPCKATLPLRLGCCTDQEYAPGKPPFLSSVQLCCC